MRILTAAARAIRVARRLDGIRRKQPHVQISQYAQLTPNPKVAVSVVSRSGSTTIDAFPDHDAGNAGATLRASSLANVLGLPVVDRRAEATNEANSERTMTADWRRLPAPAVTA